MFLINAVATAFRKLREPRKPLELDHVYALLSARAGAQLPYYKALATASYAVVEANEFEDAESNLETDLDIAKTIAQVAKQFEPLNVHAFGYRRSKEESASGNIKLGAVGMNLEDCDRATRVERAVDAAKKNGADNLAVNAGCGHLVRGGDMSEAIERGKAYVQAGAAIVYMLSGRQRFDREDISEFEDAFEGRLNIGLGMAPGKLTVKDLAELGPQIHFKANAATAQEVEAIFRGWLVVLT